MVTNMCRPDHPWYWGRGWRLQALASYREPPAGTPVSWAFSSHGPSATESWVWAKEEPGLGKSSLFVAGTGVVVVTSGTVSGGQTAVALGHHAACWAPARQG